MEKESAHVPPENILNEELESLIMASIQTRKRSNKKCGKEEVLELVNNSLQKEISRDIFKSFIQVNRKTICTPKKNLFVTTKKILVDQRKQSNCWHWKKRR